MWARSHTSGLMIGSSGRCMTSSLRDSTSASVRSRVSANVAARSCSAPRLRMGVRRTVTGFRYMACNGSLAARDQASAVQPSFDSLLVEPLDVRHVARLRELHEQPGVLEWWGPMEDGFPFDEPESTRYAVVVDGQIAGLVQHGEETWPDNRHAYIDIFIGDEFA